MSKFRDFRLKKKLSSSNDNSAFIDIGSNEVLGTKAMDTIVKQAKKSGVLILANRNLTEIPKEVYEVNSVLKSDDATINFEQTNDMWWDDVFLTKLIVTANSISNISEDISLLDKLNYLDISDNKISVLPKSIDKLHQLKFFNISKNKISSLPENMENFQEMQQLQCSSNMLKSLPSGVSSLSYLMILDISHNEFTEFPSSIAKLSSLTKIDMSYNQITSMPFALDKLQNLQVLDLSHNKLHTFCEEFSAPVQQLWLHVNRLSNFPITVQHKNLKELTLNYNMITSLTTNNITNMPNLCTLVMANNKITELPEEISKLNSLSNLDVSNNDLNNLPLSIGNMEQLNCFAIDGNPFRSIKRSVINSGAESIKQYLRMRNTVDEPDASFGPGMQALNRLTIQGGSTLLDQTDLRATGIVKLSSKGLTELSDEILKSLEFVTVKSFNLNGNKITTFPMKLFQFANTLYDLDLSSNQILELPSSIDSLQQLNRLNVSHNRIRSLPDSLSRIQTLKHLTLSYNELGDTIPNAVCNIHQLNGLAMSHCGLKILDASKIRLLVKLEMLDVSNNSISFIPPELGQCENIKSLNLDGNCFKVPRAAVISKGTASVLEYLRSRIVPS